VPSPRIAVVVLSLLVAGLVACSQFRVRTDHDPQADFSRFRTFAWLPLDKAEPADQRVYDRAVDSRIRARVDAELRSKGFTPANDGAPDFFVNYRLSTNPDSDMRGGPWAGMRGASWSAGDWWTGRAGTADTYDVGTLYLAVNAATARRMIWVGAAEARLLPHISLKKRLKRVDAAVDKILADFPPR
jgi:hypothetical protein